MKTKILLTLFLLACFVFSCSDDPSPFKCSACTDTPDALAANDNSGKGIYKGDVVGSTGNILFDISNSNSTIKGTLVLDGKKYPLQTDATYDGGFEGYFYGTMNTTDDIEILFYASDNGEEYGIFYVIIPGHDNLAIHLFKELSTELVRVFEGTFTGDASGIFNLTTRGDEWIVRAKSDDDQSGSSFYGTLTTDGAMNCDGCGDVTLEGKITGDVISGTWLTSDESGTWSGKRTL